MKKFYFSLSVLILSAFLYNFTFAQDEIQEKNVIITYTWSRIQSHGSNQIAIWIEDTLQNHICTLFATRFTTTGGYVYRPLSLGEWTAKFDLKNASKEEVDAITGSTPQSGLQIVSWNCKDKSGKAFPAGTYIVRMEANILDADKMFFSGKIKIGGSAQQTLGEITYSSPNLASGNVLFKDVLVEYK
jgi:hypothetical protein